MKHSSDRMKQSTPAAMANPKSSPRRSRAREDHQHQARAQADQPADQPERTRQMAGPRRMPPWLAPCATAGSEAACLPGLCCHRYIHNNLAERTQGLNHQEDAGQRAGGYDRVQAEDPSGHKTQQANEERAAHLHSARTLRVGRRAPVHQQQRQTPGPAHCLPRPAGTIACPGTTGTSGIRHEPSKGLAPKICPIMVPIRAATKAARKQVPALPIHLVSWSRPGHQ